MSSVLTLAQLAVASNAFDGKEKTGMDSVLIAAFFNELEKIGADLTTEARGSIKEKKANELTNAAGTIRRLAQSGRSAAQEVKAVSHSYKPGVTQAFPQMRPHVRTTQIPGGFKAPAPASAAGATGVTRPSIPKAIGENATHIRQAPASPGMRGSGSLRRTLAIGGAAGVGGAMAGHMLPHHDQQAQPHV